MGQFGSLGRLQEELEALRPGTRIRLFGVNGIGYENGNPFIATAADLPWLQDVEGQDVWQRWNPVYRDVVIVDPAGQRIEAYNLTTHDLSNPEHYAELRDRLLELEDR